MGYSLIKIGDTYNSTNIREYMIDGEEDKETLPTDCDPGSVAATADMTLMYRLDNQRKWKRVGGEA